MTTGLSHHGPRVADPRAGADTTAASLGWRAESSPGREPGRRRWRRSASRVDGAGGGAGAEAVGAQAGSTRPEPRSTVPVREPRARSRGPGRVNGAGAGLLLAPYAVLHIPKQQATASQPGATTLCAEIQSKDLLLHHREQ